jgi:hypothetical protein
MRHLAVVILAAFVASFPPAAWAGFTSWMPSPNEPDLDEILDTLYGWENLERIEDFGDVTTDELWFNMGAQAQVRAKYAGFDQTFGYFAGPEGEEFVELFTVTEQGYVNEGSAEFTSGETGSVFRFGNKPSGSPHWSSRIADNPDGLDHMIAFRIKEPPQLGVGNAYGRPATSRYVLAWEDLTGLGDKDYNDLVVEVSGVAPVPEPGTMALFGIGSLGMAFWRWRRRRTLRS